MKRAAHCQGRDSSSAPRSEGKRRRDSRSRDILSLSPGEEANVPARGLLRLCDKMFWDSSMLLPSGVRVTPVAAFLNGTLGKVARTRNRPGTQVDVHGVWLCRVLWECGCTNIYITCASR
eukprot:scaffold591_cov372-Prasinococcus_capsulatus_cf.AAC.6